MSDVLTSGAWLYATLTGDATLSGLVGGRIYEDIAPPKSAYPVVIYTSLSGVPRRIVGVDVILWDELYLVKVVGETKTYADLSGIGNRIRTVLDAKNGTVLGGTVISCVEESVVKYSEAQGDFIYKHLGFEFRIMTQ